MSSNVRVLKAHVDAAEGALQGAAVLAKVDGPRAAAAHLAEAVVTAEDGVKTRYCVIVLDEGGTTWTFGPYPTAAAAHKAVATGGIPIGGRAGVWPLIPAPKKGWVPLGEHTGPVPAVGAP
jgi:hypothetical protein